MKIKVGQYYITTVYQIVENNTNGYGVARFDNDTKLYKVKFNDKKPGVFLILAEY
jgi:hypothetical protein